MPCGRERNRNSKLQDRDSDTDDVGDIRSAFVALLDRAVTILRTTLMGSVMQGLASDLATNPVLGRAYHDEVISLRRATVRELVQGGIDRGEIRDDTEVELVHDLLFGPVYYRLLLSDQALDEGLATRIVDSVLPAIVTPPASRRTRTGHPHQS